MDEEELLDRVYEAGAIPELWPEVLARFDAVADVHGSVLFVIRGQTMHWTASPPFHDLAVDYLQSGYLGRDDRTVRLLAENHQGFLTDRDVFTPEEWEADPIRRDFWAPRGLGWGVATNVQVPTGDMLIFHGERRADQGVPGKEIIARLDRLRPHLARAALLSARVEFERVRGAVAALDLVGIPAAVLDHRGQAIITNTRLDALNPAVVLARPSRLALADTAADAMLAATMETLHGPRALIGPPHSIPVPASEVHPPMVVHIHPIRGQARDIFTSASAILLVTPVSTAEVPSASVIQGLFDLTPAEARVARTLATGLTIKQIAASTGTSEPTIRNQVRAVFAKTGIHRQADLVGLLRGLTPKS